MKYTVKVHKKVEADAELTYFVEADSKFDAECNYENEGILVRSECNYDVTQPEFNTYVTSVNPYRKTDGPKFLVILKQKRKLPVIVYYDLSGNKAIEKAKELREFLDVEKVSDKTKEYEYVSVLSQEDNFII